MDCRNSLIVAVCLPLALIGCATPDQVRMAPPAPLPPPPGVPASTPVVTTNNQPQVAQVKKTEADKLKTKIHVMMIAANETAMLANSGVAKFSVQDAKPGADGKVAATVDVKDIELQKADLRERARRQYQEVLALDPKHWPAYQGLMHVYLKSGDLNLALEAINKAVELAPGHMGLLCDQARCHMCRKEWGQAESSLRSALQMEPQNRDLRKQLGFALARAGKFGEAVEILGSVYHNVPGYGFYEVAMIIYQNIGQEEHCKQFLRQAVQANPNLENARAMLYDLEHPEEPQVRPAQGIQEPVPVIRNGVFETEG